MINCNTLDQHLDALYHSEDFQQAILEAADRHAIIAWLCWNDHDGCYTDEDSEAEGLPPMPVDLAQAIMRRQMEG